MRSLRLAPPPRCRAVTTPLLFRPAFLLIGSSRDFSGVGLVISPKEAPILPRMLGEVGRYVFKAKIYLLCLWMPSLPSVLLNKLPMLMFGHLLFAFLNNGTQFYSLF
jgi:hypothetical protein